MKQKIFVLILMLISSVMVFAETFDELKLKADNTFYSGKYGEARNLYTILWGDYADDYAKQQISICDKCKKYLEEGVDAEREGNYDTALEKYEAVEKLNPRDSQIKNLISQCKKKKYEIYLSNARQLYKEGKYSEAKENLRSYYEQSGMQDIPLLNSISECLSWSREAQMAFNSKDYERAESYYNKIIALNPSDAISQRAIADIKGLTKKTEYVPYTYTNKNKANGTALAYSIIPGLGLIQKGHTAEGVSYLVGDVALVGAGIGCTLSMNNQKKIMNDRNTTFDAYKKAKNSYDSAKTGSYICYGAAGAVYVLNLVRSYIARPKPNAPLQWGVSTDVVSNRGFNGKNDINLTFTLSYIF